MKMKVAYLGKMQLSDIDLSYLNEAQRLNDVTYFVEVNPRFMQGPAYSIKRLWPHTGIFRATDVYPELARFSSFIDTDKFYVVNTPGRLWVVKSFWTHLLLTLFLLRQGFGAIHLAWPPNIYEMVLYVLRRRMVLTVHDPFVHTGNDSAIVRLRRKVAFRLVPRLLILNEAQREAFIRHYRLRPGQVANGIMGCYTCLRTLRPDPTVLPGSRKYILFAGKISPYKGLDYLLPAMRKAHSQCPDCHLIVAGSGKCHFDTSPYEALPYIDIRNRYIPEAELATLISHAQFMVCPYTDATQSGVVMSAFAFATPVVATNVGGLPETVKDGRYGIVVKEKDSDALAAAIVRLWKDEGEAHTFSRNISQDYATGERSWRKAAEQLAGIYAAIQGRQPEKQ